MPSYSGPVYNAVRTYNVEENLSATSRVVNGDSTFSASFPSGTTLILPDITFTDYNGTTSTVASVKNISATQLTRTYAYPLGTGITTSYFTGDDRWQQLNVFNSIPTMGYIVMIDPDDRTKLLGNNTFGNDNRFTDSVGGQTYANNYIIDHWTGMGWYRVWTSYATGGFANAWEAQLDGVNNLSAAGFTDWIVPNIRALNSIADLATTSSTPFNLNTSSPLYVSCTTLQPASSFYYVITLNANQIVTQSDAKTSANAVGRVTMPCRRHF